MNNNRIPVTIITGFLGSGKTTLLNNLIKKYHDKKFAIIENEIGEIGIDGGLIVDADENIFELTNGCICCSLSKDFHRIIYKLLEGPYEFNHLIIETTGIADPDSIIQPFISSPEIKAHFILDSVIGLADAVNMKETMGSQPEVRKQLALSDIILLNKTDAVQKVYREELVRALENINPTAKVFPVSFADISSIEILDTFFYSAKTIQETTLSFQNLTVLQSEVDKSSFVHTQTTRHQHHIKTEGFIIPGSFIFNKFSTWMRNYIFFNKKNIYRVKGILSFEGMSEQNIFQAVRSDYTIDKGNPWNNEMRFSKLIFIGKHIDRDELEDSLYQLISNMG